MFWGDAVLVGELGCTSIRGILFLGRAVASSRADVAATGVFSGVTEDPSIIES